MDVINFDFKTDYILEDDFVKLRPLQNNDFEHLIHYSTTESDIWEYNMGGANGKENLLKYIENATSQRKNEKQYAFIVFDKRTNKYIGSTRFYNIDIISQTIEIGYTWYGKNYQGTGINKNCKYLLFEFAFDMLQMQRIGFGANSKNSRSINAMKSVGCMQEGILRSRSMDAAGNRIDATILSILKPEWDNEWKEKLNEKKISIY